MGFLSSKFELLHCSLNIGNYAVFSADLSFSSGGHSGTR